MKWPPSPRPLWETSDKYVFVGRETPLYETLSQEFEAAWMHMEFENDVYAWFPKPVEKEPNKLYDAFIQFKSESTKFRFEIRCTIVVLAVIL